MVIGLRRFYLLAADPTQVSPAALTRHELAAIAAGVAAAASLIFAASGLCCPPTGLAERLGVGKGSVTGIYLPR